MDYWAVHGFWLLVGLTFLPRLTVIIGTLVGALALSYGILFWIGFILFPRIFIAILAAYNYWDTNPVLVVIACLLCLGGEGCEKGAATHAV